MNRFYKYIFPFSPVPDHRFHYSLPWWSGDYFFNDVIPVLEIVREQTLNGEKEGKINVLVPG
jgi:hypothetical protein